MSGAVGGGGRERILGILLMTLAVLFFAATDAIAKWLSASVDPLVIAWARYASNVVLVSLVLNPVRRPAVLRSSRIWLQVARSALLLLTTVLNFFGLRHLQLTQTISIQFGMPLLVALLAGPMLGEWPGPRRLVAIAVGFCGVMIITRPGSGALHPAAIFTAASTVCYAFYAILTRRLAGFDTTATTTIYTGLVGFVMMTPLAPFAWNVPANPAVWILLAATGLTAGMGHWLLVLAHARAPAPVLSPFLYTQIIWMAVLGWLVFGDVPDRWTALGGFVVIASGLYLLSQERARRSGPSRRGTA